MLHSIIKKGSELSPEELEVMNRERKKVFDSQIEWNEITKEHFFNDLFFVIKNSENTIVSFGRLIDITVFVEQTPYMILGIGSIVSVTWKKGYGKELMSSMKKYILEKGKTAVGFCGEQKSEFYRKCGFEIISQGVKNFVYVDKKGKRNFDEGDVVYLSGKDGLVEKILNNPHIVIEHEVPHW